MAGDMAGNVLDLLDDPKLLAITRHVFRVVRLSTERAIAHHSEPSKYPISSDSNSFEQIMMARFRTRPAPDQQRAMQRTMKSIGEPASSRAKRFGILSGIELTDPAAIEARATSHEFTGGLKLSHASLSKFATSVGASGFVPQASTNRVELRIRAVKCFDETDGPGSDEILLGGVAVDETGDSKVVNYWKVSDDFDEGDNVWYEPPKRFTHFWTTEGGNNWPKSYFCTICLAEQDNGGFGDWLAKLLKKVRDYVAPLVGAGVGGLIGGAIGNVVGAVVGAIAGAVIGMIIEWITGWWDDDPLNPITVHCSIGGYDTNFSSSGSLTSAAFENSVKGQGGHYRVRYDWRKFHE